MTKSTGSDFCFLKDQKPISQEAFANARQLCTQIGALVASREEYLRRMRRDPEIHLPHGNWELPRRLYGWYRTVMGGDYDVINHLRLFTQVFTGFQLTSLSRGSGKPIPQTVPPDLDEQLAVLARTPGPYVDAYLEVIAHLPEILHITPPNVFGEVGWVADGKIINHDTHAYLERVVLLAECGKLWELRNRTPEGSALGQGPGRRPCILEIGGGFGGLAYHLRKLVPHARYVIVDIPEALLVSSIYLSTLFPEGDNVLVTPDQLHLLQKDSAGFTFVPNFLFDECCTSGREFDLVLNTLSMSEMTERQVSYYAEGIRRLLGQRGVFFEQNQDNRPVCMLDARLILARHLPLCLPLGSFVMPVIQGQPHLWAAAHVKPYTWRPSAAVCQDGLAALLAPAYRNEAGGQPKLIEEGYFGINVIYYRGGWYGLPQGTGPFDPVRVANKDYPLCFTAESKDKLMKTIRARCGC
jgi:hypothetical protein